MNQTLDYPPLPSELTGSWWHVLRIFGPGVIIASVTVGTGETIFAPRVGAIFGYGLLWVAVITVLFKGVQVYTGARHLVLTGEHPMQAWTRLPGPRAWVPWLIGLVAVLSFPLWIAALADAIGNLLMWVTGLGNTSGWGRPLWATVMIVAAMLLSLVQTYGAVERVSAIILTLKVVLILIAVVVVRPDWAAVAWGAIAPQLPELPAWVSAQYPDVARRPLSLELATLMGAVGGGVQDYVGYVGFLREKRWGLAAIEDGGPSRLSIEKGVVERGKAWLRAPQLDCTFSFGTVALMTCCFMILGAAVLHPQMQVPTDRDLYSQQAQFLAVIHPQLVVIYKAGIFFAIFGVLYAAFELYTHTTHEPLKAIWPNRTWNVSKLRLIVVLYSGLGGLALLWTGWKTVTLASIISPFSGVLGCGFWCLAMLWVDSTQMPAPYRMNRMLYAITLIAGLVMVAVGGFVTLRF
jgi:Mn2+/Fe2+ NRAMP family transporter